MKLTSLRIITADIKRLCKRDKCKQELKCLFHTICLWMLVLLKPLLPLFVSTAQRVIRNKLDQYSSLSMGVKRRRDAFEAFITKDLERIGLVIDLIVKIGDDRYKSEKYRHRYYKSEDFELTFDAVLQHHLSTSDPTIAINP